MNRESFESVRERSANHLSQFGTAERESKYKSLKKMKHAFIIGCRPMA